MLAALVIPCGVALLFPQHRAIAPTTAGRVSSRPVVALAGGGFGAAKAPAKPKKKGKGKKGAVPAHTEKALRDLNERAEAEARARGGYAKGKDVKVVNSVEEARAEEERLKAAEEAEAAQRDAHMLLVRAAVEIHAPAICDGLAEKGYAVIDGFLEPATVAQLRAEAVGLQSGGDMKTSESTRWDDEAGEVVTYQKVNVLSTDLKGGADYKKSPRLTEYCVTLVQSLPPLVNERFESATLSNKLHTNKLAVCLGDGSHYDKHYDNSGGDDLRKLTVLVYLQENWEERLGGHFRMFEADGDGHTDIAPEGGRLLAFWSDSMVHAVMPSHVESDADHRWALTCWLHATDPKAVQFDDAAERRHFAESVNHRGVAG